MPQPENVSANTLKQAMARIMGEGPTLSPEQTAGTANPYYTITPTSYGANPVSAPTTAGVSADEAGAYDPQGKMKELQLEQLKFQQYATQVNHEQQMKALADQQAFNERMAAQQAANDRARLDIMNQQLEFERSNRPQQPSRPPPPSYAPQPAYQPMATAPSGGWNANPSQQERRMSTQQIPWGQGQVGPGSPGYGPH
jgi:hypothetical protein